MSKILCPDCGTALQPSVNGSANGAVCPRCAAGIPPSDRLMPEQLEWARGLCNEDEILAGLAEVRAGGGKEMHEFIHQIERAAGVES